MSKSNETGESSPVEAQTITLNLNYDQWVDYDAAQWKLWDEQAACKHFWVGGHAGERESIGGHKGEPAWCVKCKFRDLP